MPGRSGKPRPEGRYWRQLRKAVLQRDKLCVACGATENLTVDHIVRLADGGRLYCAKNMQVLCEPCHKLKDQRAERLAGDRTRPPDHILRDERPTTTYRPFAEVLKQ